MIGDGAAVTAPGPATTRRRVRRIVRKFDPWTVLKVSAVLTGLAALALVLLSVIGWAVISRLGFASAFDSAAQRVALIEPDESPLQDGRRVSAGHDPAGRHLDDERHCRAHSRLGPVQPAGGTGRRGGIHRLRRGACDFERSR